MAYIPVLNGHLGVLGEFGVLLQSQCRDCSCLDDAFSWRNGEAVDFDLQMEGWRFENVALARNDYYSSTRGDGAYSKLGNLDPPPSLSFARHPFCYLKWIPQGIRNDLRDALHFKITCVLRLLLFPFVIVCVHTLNAFLPPPPTFIIRSSASFCFLSKTTVSLSGTRTSMDSGRIRHMLQK